VYTLWSHCLFSQFLSFLFWQFHKHFMYAQIVVYSVIAQCQSYFLFLLFSLCLFITAFFFTSRSGVAAVVSFVSALIIIVSFCMNSKTTARMMPLSAFRFWSRAWSSSIPGCFFLFIVSIALFFSFPLISHLL
jgi:hypothetical protein